MAKLHKIEFYLVDCDEEWNEDLIDGELASLFDWHGITVTQIKTVDIGEWHDDHKFNFISTPLEEYEKEFE